MSLASGLLDKPEAPPRRSTAAFAKTGQPICAAEAMGHLELVISPAAVVNKVKTAANKAREISSEVLKLKGQKRKKSWILRQAANRFFKTTTRAEAKAEFLTLEAHGVRTNRLPRGFWTDMSMFIGNVFTAGAIGILKGKQDAIVHKLDNTAMVAIGNKKAFRALSNATVEIVHTMEFNFRDQMRVERLHSYTSDTEVLIDHMDHMIDGIDHLTAGRLSPSVVSPAELQRGLNLVAEDARRLNLTSLVKTVTEAYHLPVSVVREPKSDNITIFIHIPLGRGEHWQTFEYLPAPVWPFGHPVTLLSSDSILGMKDDSTVSVSGDEWQDCISLHDCKFCKQADIVRDVKSSCLGAIYWGLWKAAFTLCRVTDPVAQVNAIRTADDGFWVTSPVEVEFTMICRSSGGKMGLEESTTAAPGSVGFVPLKLINNITVISVLGGEKIKVPPGCEARGGGLTLRPPRDLSPEIKTLHAPSFDTDSEAWPEGKFFGGAESMIDNANKILDETPDSLDDLEDSEWSALEIVQTAVLSFLVTTVIAASIVGSIALWKAKKLPSRPLQRPDKGPEDVELHSIRTESPEAPPDPAETPAGQPASSDNS